MTRHQSNDAVLRRVLLANALFSTITAFACLFAAQGIADALFATEFSLLGLSPAETIFELGIGLLAFATVVALIATRNTLGRRWAKPVIAADLLWVLDSAVLLAVYPGHFTPMGFEIVLIVAVIVALFAVGQSLGLALLYQGESDITVARDRDRTTLTASIDTKASARAGVRPAPLGMRAAPSPSGFIPRRPITPTPSPDLQVRGRWPRREPEPGSR